jgi:release factor glutamine methyltransferase
MTVREALTESSAAIARRDAEVLLAHTLECDRAWLLAHPEAQLAAAHVEALRSLVARRAAHEPLQYLTGVQEFYGLTLHVTPDTLIPRPETELLVEAVLGWAAKERQRSGSQRLRILDIGTGTGAIALALAANLPRAEITGSDISAAALDVARGNAERLGLSAQFIEADLLRGVAAGERTGHGLYDAIVSNPPYIPNTDAPALQPEVRDHEPPVALFGGRDGLDVYRRLVPQALDALRPGGLLALEIGFGQRDALAALLAEAGWAEVRFLDDLQSIPRVVTAMRPPV